MGQRILIKTDKNGTEYWADYTCPRCGGIGGADVWKHTGWKCYQCGGTGKVDKPDIWKKYTPEYAEKLRLQREKREAKKRAEHEAKMPEIRKAWLEANGFNADGYTFIFLGNTYERKEDIKAIGGKYHGLIGWHIAEPVDGFLFLRIHVDEVTTADYFQGYQYDAETFENNNIKARLKEAYNKQKGIKEQISQYFGEVGDKIDLVLTYTHTASWPNGYGGYWNEGVTNLHSFKDNDGNVFIWKTGKFIEADYGTKLRVSGTIKEHSEYRDTKQTVLTRCKIQEVK